jgi:glycosyltransferase involved in cell wall biosynthesis
VPAWGPYAGPALADAVDSLRVQDLPARILVVDNASQETLPQLEGAEVIRTTRRLTLGAARNFGLARVTTPYVTFWDADDLMPAGTLRFLRERSSHDPALVAAAAGIVEDDPRIRHR